MNYNALDERCRSIQHELEKSRDNREKENGEWERKYRELNEQLRTERAGFTDERKAHIKEIEGLFQQRDNVRLDLANIKKERDAERDRARALEKEKGPSDVLCWAMPCR